MENNAEMILEVLKKTQLQKICQENGLSTFITNKVLRAGITESAATNGNSLRVRSINIQNFLLGKQIFYLDEKLN